MGIRFFSRLVCLVVRGAVLPMENLLAHLRLTASLKAAHAGPGLGPSAATRSATNHSSCGPSRPRVSSVLPKVADLPQDEGDSCRYWFPSRPPGQVTGHDTPNLRPGVRPEKPAIKTIAQRRGGLPLQPAPESTHADPQARSPPILANVAVAAQGKKATARSGSLREVPWGSPKKRVRFRDSKTALHSKL